MSAAMERDWDSPPVFIQGLGNTVLYQDFVAKLFKPLDTDNEELNHAALGIGGEAGEIMDAIKKATIYNKPLDRDNIIEELGDLRFYMQALMNKLNIKEYDVLQGNANKLAKRYPTGDYSDADAIARADKNET